MITGYELVEEKIKGLWDKEKFHFHFIDETSKYANHSVVSVQGYETAAESKALRLIDASHCLARIRLFNNNFTLYSIKNDPIPIAITVQVQATIDKKSNLMIISFKTTSFEEEDESKVIQTEISRKGILCSNIRMKSIVQHLLEKFEKQLYKPAGRNCYHIVSEIYLAIQDIPNSQKVLKKLEENKNKANSRIYKIIAAVGLGVAGLITWLKK